jgi:hypothetical protein
MVAGYVHIEVELAQSSKRAAAPCGDVAACERTPAATTLVCTDGIGSGVRARIAAQMCTSRILESLRLGASLRKAFASVVRTMEGSRDPSRPFAAFSVARIRNDGMATVVSYEAPAPLLVSRRHAAPLPQSPVELGGALAMEANCYLEPGDALLVMSDGITQAGIGDRFPMGWQTEGVTRYVNDRLLDGAALKDVPQDVHREARQLWRQGGDDCTVAMALCRRGQIVNVFSGPPADRSADAATVRRFIQSEGLKIVCGGSTAELVARVMKQRVRVEQDSKSLIAPPRYEIEGIDLVTEGAVTLNQVYNVFDEDIRNLKEDSGVTELCALLQIADRVNIVQGGAKSRAAGDITFVQRGILGRDRIIPLLVEKLRTAGKLVVVEQA